MDTQGVFVDTVWSLRGGGGAVGVFSSLNKLYVCLCIDNDERNLNIYLGGGERDAISR